MVDKDGSAVKGLKLGGKWDVELVAQMPDGSSRRLWQKSPPAADPSRSALTCMLPCADVMGLKCSKACRLEGSSRQALLAASCA